MGKKAKLAARERVKEMRARHERAERRRRVLIAAAAGVAALAVVAGVVLGVLQARKPEALAAVKTFQVSQGHTTQPVKYPQTPPAGGQHNPVWLNCGVYTEPVPAENAVHAQEHGAVWITYRPDLPSGDVAKLREQVEGREYVVLSPYPDLPAAVVASAWGTQLTLNGADDERLGAFLDEYVQGPQAPEPGAPCTGGTGQPQT